LKSSPSHLYGVFIFFLFPVFIILSCDLFDNSMVDYFLDNTGIVEVTGIGGRPTYAVMDNGTILIPPADNEPVTILEVALSNPRSLFVRQELLGVPEGKHITARQSESNMMEVLIEGAVLGDEFALTIAMQSPDGLRDFAGCNLQIRCVSFNTALSDFRVNETHPFFDQDQYSFTVELPYETTELTLEGIALAPDATLEVFQGRDDAGTLIASGSGRVLTAVPAALSLGSNYFYLKVSVPGAVQGYTVDVIRMQAPDKHITEFYFTIDSKRYGAGSGVEADSGSIVGTGITVSVPYGTDIRALTASVSHTGASIDPDPAVPGNYADPVTYTVTAADGSTADYTVTVKVGPNTDKALTGFTITGPVSAVGIINEDLRAVTVSVPYGTSLVSMDISIAHTGVSVTPPSGTPQSGSPAVFSGQNLTGSKTYRVTAEDGTYQDYTVTVNEHTGLTISGITVERLGVFTFTQSLTTVSPNTEITITALDHTNTEVTVTDANWYIDISGPDTTITPVGNKFTPTKRGFYNINVFATINNILYSGSFGLIVE
jgi:hypothetical protein